MAWELRQNGERYFYYARRVNGRVIKDYYGKGPVAELAAQRLEAVKQARRAERERLTRLKREALAQDQALNRVQPIESRRPKVNRTNQAPRHLSLNPQLPPVPADVLQRFNTLIAARETGHKEGEAELTRLVEQHPALWMTLGDLTRQTVESWIALVGGKDGMFRAAIRRQLASLQERLAAATDDPAGQLIVDRIVVTWIQAAYADSRLAQAREADAKTLDHLVRRQQQAQRQHLAALQAWRQWRRLEMDLPIPGPQEIDETHTTPESASDPNPYILPFRRGLDVA